ncbi:MAG: hypothetical protein QOE96_1200, partial [Blastocatellia bacterium]|nr:hypothetical protein [Blastocatellia bacterium]
APAEVNEALLRFLGDDSARAN